MRKIKYWIIDMLHLFAIRYKFVKLEDLMWEVKWQQTLKWYGEQDWNAPDIWEPLEIPETKEQRILFKIFT